MPGLARRSKRAGMPSVANAQASRMIAAPAQLCHPGTSANSTNASITFSTGRV